MKTLVERDLFRKLRVRSKIRATSGYPRLSVYRSLKHIYAQVIDDVQGKTLVAASSRDKGLAAGNGVKKSMVVGEALGKKALAKGIQQVVFDRGGKRYHGRIKALAEGARQAGLKI